MSTTNAAAAFLKQNLGMFGVTGSNNKVEPHLGRGAIPAPPYEFTKDNHFRFGYDGGEFNVRNTGAALYWVEYGRATRKHEGLRAELSRALIEIRDRFGAISISNSGTSQSRALIFEAKEAGLDVQQISLQIDNYPVPKPYPEVPNRLVKVSWEGFCKFARSFCSLAGNGDPWVALEAYHAEVAERPHLMTHARLNVLHNGHDSTKRRVVDAALWSVVDYEQTTAPNRWLCATGRVGLPQPFYWSPELIAAQLDAPLWRDRTHRASIVPPDLDPSKAIWNSLLLLRQTYPKLAMARSSESARNSKQFSLHMGALRKRLRRANPGCIAMHGAPLHRVLENLGVVYDPPADAGRQIFGDVASTASPAATA